MDVAELVLDYLDTLKWPVVVLALATVLIWRYHDEIGRLLAGLFSRVKSLETPIGRATFEPGEQVVATDGPVSPNAADELDLARQSQQQLQATVEQLQSEYNALRAFFLHEYVFRIIYGTQIELLHGLNAVYPQGVDETRLPSTSHARFLELSKAGDWSLEQYLRFLFFNGLMEKLQATNTYRITENGRAFLQYLANMDPPPQPKQY